MTYLLYMSLYMSSKKTLLNELNDLLVSVFADPHWTTQQYQIYQLIKQYSDSFQIECKQYDTKNDKINIRNNLRDQIWYVHSKSKPIINQLIDDYQITQYISEHTEMSSYFMLILSFHKYSIKCHYYQNQRDKLTIYYICVEKGNQTGYLTYVNPINTFPTKLPDLDKVYQIMNLSPNIICQCDLLGIIVEIVCYYDEAQKIADFPISNSLNITLNQLLDKFNQYINNKASDS